MVARGKDSGERIVREFGMGMYTLLYLKWITNKDLLCSIGNSAQCYVAAWMGGEFGMDMNTLLHLKGITNKDLLYSTGNSAQCYVAAFYVRGDFEGEWIRVYVWLSPFAVHLKLSQRC